MAAFDFNPTEAEPSRGEYAAVPAGKYLLQAVQIDENVTKAGTGKFLAFQWEILDGEFAGQRVFDNINTHNPSDVAQRIGREQLSAICTAIAGQGADIRDTDELLFKPVVGNVKFIPVGTVDRKSGYEHTKDKNEIGGYSPANSCEVAPARPVAAPVVRQVSPPPARPVAVPASMAATVAGRANAPWKTPRATG